MDIKTKIGILRKATGRLAREVDVQVEEQNYVGVAALAEEAGNLKIWLEDLEAEEPAA